MFTKIGVTLASGAFPVLLWAGAAGAQQSPETTQSQSPQTTQSQSQSQSQQTQPTVTTLPQTTNTGTLARTGAEDVLPLAAGGAVLAGAVAYFGLRRRSVS